MGAVDDGRGWVGGADVVEVGVADVVHPDEGAGFGGAGLDEDVAEFDLLRVAEIEAVGGGVAEHFGLGVGGDLFGDVSGA